MKIGFIGLGTMGRHMAANLQKSGHELVVHDVRREAGDAHVKAGARWADSPRAVAEAADVVFTSLPEPRDVEAVALDEKTGLLAGLTAGKAFFDLSTNSPTVVRRLHAVFKARGVHMFDAPVSGGPKGAESGRLALWIGGDEEAFKKYKPVVDAIGDRAYYVGPIGAGSVAKLVHNCAGYMVQTAMAEVFTMGVKAGVDPLTIWKAVRQGAGGRRGLPIVQRVEVLRVRLERDEHVTRVYLPDVHEGERRFVLVHDGGGNLLGDDFAEHTVGHFCLPDYSVPIG